MSLLFSAYPFIRSALFSMDAETAHNTTLSALARLNSCNITRAFVANNQGLKQKPITLMGLKLKNAVGLAAGLDKNGEYVDALGALGFGFVEVGTVTPLPQEGNPKPRMFRLPEAGAIINRMGFNNQGLERFIANVKSSQWQANGGVLGLNIGKNAVTPNDKAIDDYLIGLEGVYPYADYITVNISSPNTENLRDLQGHDELNALLSTLQQKKLELAQQYNRTVPLAVKIAPDLNNDQIDVIAEVLLKNNIDGVIATNTTVSRTAVQNLRYADQAGGLSGPPVHQMSLDVIQRLRQQLGNEFAIVGVGGISSAQQAIEKMQAGANAVQIYTGLIYQGPNLVKQCVSALSEL